MLNILANFQITSSFPRYNIQTFFSWYINENTLYKMITAKEGGLKLQSYNSSHSGMNKAKQKTKTTTTTKPHITIEVWLNGKGCMCVSQVQLLKKKQPIYLPRPQPSYQTYQIGW